MKKKTWKPYRPNKKQVLRLIELKFARQKERVVRRLFREEKRLRKKKLEAKTFSLVVLTDEQVTLIHKKETSQRKARKLDKKEARQKRLYEKKERQRLKEQNRLEPRWARELDAADWKETQKGWRQGNKASLPIREALAEKRKVQKTEHLVDPVSNLSREDLRIIGYLSSKGWGINGRDAFIQNWEASDGLCHRTIRQAYKIQLALDAKQT